jgi:proline iminopeptidase
VLDAVSRACLSFYAADGTELAYHLRGDGAPLVCLPGGPGRASAYLGDLGGVSAYRQLITLDVRGTGESAVPADPDSYRCDHLVDDVAALQEHLALDRFDLLGHSAGANIAVQYAVRYPQRVGKLALVTPSGRSVGLQVDDQIRREMIDLRQGEPWFAEAAAALERDADTDEDQRAIAPFFYGRWDTAARTHWAAGESQTNEDAARGFAAAGAFDPAATCAAVAMFGSPVLVLAGGVDLLWPPGVVGELAALFPAAQLVVQPGAGHYPWLDDPEWFVSAITPFLGDKL